MRIIEFEKLKPLNNRSSNRIGGIIGLRHGGRPGYAEDGFVTADVEEVVSEVSPERKNQIEGNQMAEDAMKQNYV